MISGFLISNKWSPLLFISEVKADSIPVESVQPSSYGYSSPGLLLIMYCDLVCRQKLIVPQRPMTFSLMENWFSCIPPIYKGETFPISHVNVTETCTIDVKCSSSTPGCKDYYWTFAVHRFRRSGDWCFTKYVGTSFKGKLTWNHFWDPDIWDHFLQEVSYGLVILKVIKLIQKKKIKL